MYLGNTPTTQGFVPAVDYFSGNGSTTAFTLSRSVASVAQIEAVIENVPQNPNDAFTVSGNTITFTSAPPSGSNNIYVRYTSPITQVMQPSDNSVGQRQLTSDLQNSTYGFKNRIINGAMMIDQRNAGASVTPTADAQYTLDRWRARDTVASKFSVQQNAGSVTPPTGFKNYIGVTSLSAYSVGSTDYFGIEQVIEGFNASDLGWGAVGAATVTLSFWVRSSLTGTFSLNINNNGGRSYPATYTINSANTWEQKTITVAGDTSGTWLTSNGYGVGVWFNLGMGSTYNGTANTWGGGSALSVAGSTSVVGTNGATFYITGVQLEKGSTATSFDYRPYGTELALCQRYYETMYFRTTSYGNNANGVPLTVPMKVTKRATPTGVIGADPETWTLNYPTAAFTNYNADSVAIFNNVTVPSTGLARFGAIITLSAEL